MSKYITLQINDTEKYCEACGKENSVQVSETSSYYGYCNTCKNNEPIASKHLLFDSILKSLKSYLKTVGSREIFKLKISISLEGNIFLLKINDIVLSKKKCSINLTSKDEYYFKNTVNYLIEDILYVDANTINLDISF